ncbi:AAA family ATPase [Caldilinea sp.]|uniref:AAA family ATPase n=1 Tax=Caldilinea sp. TaxID=2293560 RepID=UPI0026249E86|nr:AAA family ATPase [uncultured Caldilinea sp.]
MKDLDLFEQANLEQMERSAPLAARMRPRTLDEFVGQEHIVGPGRLLRRAIEADQLSSLIFYGPPGTGKTTLARVIANTTRAHFIAINAVLAGVKEIREAIEEAQNRARLYGQRTILFVDEVHRFNKAQQDALLPWVENGTVIFIGATTENPYFEVNKALVSRSRIFQLTPLSKDDLRKIVRQALTDPERGYGKLNVTIDEDALEHLVEVANGDARAVLNALELAVETTGTGSPEGGLQPPAPNLRITLAIAEESIQRRAVLYDKEGDYHFDTISAFIKSLRGSDPDAALYWMAKMVYAGESPRFIFRRMLIFAGEDVGMADPNAIQVVNACAQAFEQVGMPEGRFHLALAALYLATAKKSNTAFAFFDALEQVAKEADSGVPNHLKDASRDKEGFGHGEGYLYPHAYRDHWVAQQYLPTSLQGKIFYQPSDQGYEATIRAEVARRREAQLAAMLDVDETRGEILTHSPDDPARERWLQRAISGAGERLARVRDRVLDAAKLSRHSVVLDLKAGSGLLTWEAVRRTPEGGVYALVRNRRDAEALRQMAERLPLIERPIVMEGRLEELPLLLALQSGEIAAEAPRAPLALRSASALRFDAIVGYNALLEEADKRGACRLLAEMLAPHGVVSLAERIPRAAQRLYALFEPGLLAPNLMERWRLAEEAIYADANDPLVNWDERTLQAALEEAGMKVSLQLEVEESETLITPAMVQRWFTPNVGGRPAYAERLAALLSSDEIAQIRALFERQLLGQAVAWRSRIAFIVARRGGE